MAAQALIQVRVEQPLKNEVAEVFSSLGLDMATAIRIFLQRCRQVRGIPFALTLPEENHVKPGQSKGKWNLPADWFEKDKELDKELEEDFYADSL